MCGIEKEKEIPRKASLLISASLCLANAHVFELLSLRTHRISRPFFRGVSTLYFSFCQTVILQQAKPLSIQWAMGLALNSRLLQTGLWEPEISSSSGNTTMIHRYSNSKSPASISTVSLHPSTVISTGCGQGSGATMSLRSI